MNFLNCNNSFKFCSYSNVVQSDNHDKEQNIVEKAKK